MKLLFFFVFYLLTLNLKFGLEIIFINVLNATEISNSNADSYEARYKRWLIQKSNIQRKKSKVSVVSDLPRLKQKSSIVQTKRAFRKKTIVDAREEFLNGIPKSNKQVRALLNMVDHTKVYFSINTDGKLSDLFKDERFQEIYSEEMSKPTRRLAYLFFKSYQDASKGPNEQLAPKLNRNLTINRDKIEAFLETTGIKSKLTRSLEGAYPKIPIKPGNDETINVDSVVSPMPAAE